MKKSKSLNKFFSILLAIAIVLGMMPGMTMPQAAYAESAPDANALPPTPVKIKVVATKKIDGPDDVNKPSLADIANKYTFTLTGTGIDDAGLTAKNATDGSITFGPIELTEDKEYSYTIQETAGSYDNITNSTDKRTVKITTSVQDGKVVVSGAKMGDGETDASYSTADGITTVTLPAGNEIINTYKPATETPTVPTVKTEASTADGNPLNPEANQKITEPEPEPELELEPDKKSVSVFKVWVDNNNTEGRPSDIQLIIHGSDDSLYLGTDAEEVGLIEADGEPVTLDDVVTLISNTITILKGLFPDEDFTENEKELKLFQDAVEYINETYGDTTIWFDGWQLPLNDKNGEEIFYAIEEPDVDGYKLVERIEPTEGAFILINEKAYPVKVSKTDLVGTEVEGAYIVIYKYNEDDENGENREFVESWISGYGDDGESESVHEFQLPTGKYIMVEELEPDGYERITTSIVFEIDEKGNVDVITKDVENGEIEIAEDGTIILKDKPTIEDTALAVMKVWLDDDNKDKKRPSSIQFTITGGGKTYKGEDENKTGLLTDEEDSTIDLDEEIEKMEALKELFNTPGEDEGLLEGAEEFKKAIDEVIELFKSIKDEYGVTKVWYNGWGLPSVDSDGYPITYEVKEPEVVEGYELLKSEFKELESEVGAGIWLVVNKLKPEEPKLTNIKVTKVWDDNENIGLRTTEVEVNLMIGDEPAKDKDGNVITLMLTEADGWTGEFKDIEALDAEGKKIDYSVREVTVIPSYYARIEGSMDEGYTITNTHRPWFPEIPGTPGEEGSFTLRKEVTGAAESDKEYEVNIKFTYPEHYVGVGESAELEYTVLLTPGEDFTVDKVPVGTKVEIVELTTGYEVSYMLNAKSCETVEFEVDSVETLNSVVVINYKAPDKPDAPDKTQTPTKTTEPKKPTTNKTPLTGDDSNAMPWILLLGVATAAFGTLTLKKGERK